MSLLSFETRIIGGKEYQIRVLSVMEGRKVYNRIQKLLAVVGDASLKESGLDPILIAGMAGHLNDGDLEFLCDKFGPSCTVKVQRNGQEAELKVSDKAVTEELFAGNFEDMFAWIAACIEVNFAGLIVKMRSALSSFGDKARDQQPKE